MITADDLRPLHENNVDAQDTIDLRTAIASLRQKRQPLFLTKDELESILIWKLGRQLGRNRARRAANTDELIRAITGLALTIEHADKEYELELKVALLCALRGVEIAIASAVLAMVFPDQYAVIDFRGWRQLFGGEGSAFTIANYKQYMREIRRLASELGWTPQQVDHAIWEYDRRHS